MTKNSNNDNDHDANWQRCRWIKTDLDSKLSWYCNKSSPSLTSLKNITLNFSLPTSTSTLFSLPLPKSSDPLTPSKKSPWVHYVMCSKIDRKSLQGGTSPFFLPHKPSLPHNFSILRLQLTRNGCFEAHRSQQPGNKMKYIKMGKGEFHVCVSQQIMKW